MFVFSLLIILRTLCITFLFYLTGIPIPGSRTCERIEENAGGAECQISPDAIKAIRDLTENVEIAGDRYSGVHMSDVEGECLPLENWKGE